MPNGWVSVSLVFGAKPPRTTSSVLGELAERHSSLLKDQERFVAASDAFGASQPHPEPDEGRRWGRQVRTPEEMLRDNAQALRRLALVQQALGMPIDEELSELPFSKNGYVLAHTERRLFVFDGSAKNYLLQAQIKGLWLQAIDHGDAMFTLVFHNEGEKVAVATRRESIELTNHFIATFPDRREQARTIDLTEIKNQVSFN